MLEARRPVSDPSTFGAAVNELSQAFERGTSLCGPFLRVLPVAGVAVSTLGAPFGSETVCASDARAARLDELQFDLGEGPCWVALTSRQPVVTSDLSSVDPRWPLFAEALRDGEVTQMFAFPLALGQLNIGAVDLYSTEPGSLTSTEMENASALAAICSRQVLQHALARRGETTDPAMDQGFSRREVHQATGMVLAQLGLSAADALLVINGYAFARGRTVREVAADIVARRVNLLDEWTSPPERL